MNNTNTRVLHEVNSFVYYEEIPRNSSTNMYVERERERESLSISFEMFTGSRAGHRDCRHVKHLVCVLQRLQIGCGPIQCSMKWVLGRGSVFLGVKRAGHEALQARLLSTEV